MKYFLSVIGQLAIWTPPEGIDGFTFKVDTRNRKVSFMMKACCRFESGTFAAYILPEHVHKALDAFAESAIRARDEAHAAKEMPALQGAYAWFEFSIAKHRTKVRQ